MRPRYEAKKIADLALAALIAKLYSGHDSWNEERLGSYRARRFESLVRFAAKHSPFYRELYQDVDLAAPIRPLELPVTNRRMLMDCFDDVLTDRSLRRDDLEDHLNKLRRDEFYRGNYRIVRSSGTTGTPQMFVFNRYEWATKVAQFFRMKKMTRQSPLWPRRTRICQIGNDHPSQSSARIRQSTNLGFAKQVVISASRSLESIRNEVERFQPDVLGGYATIIHRLAGEQLRGSLCITPQRVYTGSEVCTEKMSKQIVAAWNTTPFDIYASTEVAFGVDCPHHRGVHLLEDQCIVEVVDKHRRPVPDGVMGHKILVTNLYNRTQPLIRYEMEDMLSVSSPRCACGSPFRSVSSIGGRTVDLLELPGDGGFVSVHPWTLISSLCDREEIRQFQIVQRGDELHVYVVPQKSEQDFGSLKNQLAGNLFDQLDTMGVANATIEVHIVERLEQVRDSGGKFKLVRREV